MNVELAYRSRIDTMSAVERVRRAEALLRWSRDFLARSILSEQGPMSAGRLRKQILLRQFGADPAARRLIDEMDARDTD